MKCPHGFHELSIPDNTFINMDTYGKCVRSVTICCGKGVFLAPRTTYEASIPNEDFRHDDWGRPVKPTTKEKAT